MVSLETEGDVLEWSEEGRLQEVDMILLSESGRDMGNPSYNV